MAEEIRVTGFDHAVLRCADVERSLTFYCDELGMEAERVEEWRRGEVPFPSVRASAVTIIDLFAAQRDGINVDHLCLVVDPIDLDVLAARFPGSVRGNHLFGAQGHASSVYIHDPDGNKIELRYYDV